jgi:hypothetical protein
MGTIVLVSFVRLDIIFLPSIKQSSLFCSTVDDEETIVLELDPRRSKSNRR